MRAILVTFGLLVSFAIYADEPGKKEGPKKHGTASKHESAAKVQVGHKVPDFTVQDVDGKSWKLSELHKKVSLAKRQPIVLSFWCSFCGSCRRVEGDLEKLAQRYRGKAAVFALDASAGETADEATEAAEKAHLTFPVLLNPDGRAADIFGTKLTTTTVVIDADGVLRYCGQFSHGEHKYAEHALDAVLHGKEVHTKTTPHHG